MNRSDWITDAMALRASITHNARAAPEQEITVGQARWILEIALNKAIITSRAILLLEAENAQQAAQIATLQAHNTELLLRARKAEGERDREETLADQFGGWWSQHSDYRRCDWAAEVRDNETQLGYWAWVQVKLDNHRETEIEAK